MNRNTTNRTNISDEAQEFIKQGNDELRDIHQEPLTVSEYVDLVFENPSFASNSSKYMLEAIEYDGTRTVIENGEEIERYNFFDDPHNNGEHAILGNTQELNKFVNTLRVIASATGKTEKILWISGPTATGKSELKRCLVNGLKAYSKTAGGSRYTLEWNTATGGFDPMYANNPSENDESKWFESPVQAHPLSIFPEETQATLLNTINTEIVEGFPVAVQSRLDPASQKQFERICKTHKSSERDSLFETVINPSNVRISNYIVDIGKGIGVLHAEDSGSPKEKLAGVWLSHDGLIESGTRNPLHYSYDGVLSQGNGLLTIIEDGMQHTDLLTSLLNVMDEGEVKLDQRIRMPIDTVFLIISNPDLAAFLDQNEQLEEADPMKALKRRLEKHEFSYLTNYGLESELLKKELSGHEDFMVESEKDTKPSEGVDIKTYDTDSVTATELAPHSIETAALYNVLTRLTTDGIPSDEDDRFTLLDKARIFELGFIQKGDKRYTLEETDFEFTPDDGKSGVPVTFTRDILSDIIVGRYTVPTNHKYTSVILPQDILKSIEDHLQETPLFTDDSIKKYTEKVDTVEEFIEEQQRTDVLRAVMKDAKASDEFIEEYVEHVFAWAEATVEKNEVGEVVKPNPLEMKIFETEYLGIFDDEDYYSNNKPRSQVKEFREERITNPINRRAWFNRTEEFQPGDINIQDLEVFQSLLTRYSVEDVRREFPDFEPTQWDSPKDGTETAEVKERTIQNMVEQGYSEKSAELTAMIVMNKVSEEWD